MRALLLFASIAPLLCIAPGAIAQIHHCIGAQGEPVFTDRPCGSAELAATIPDGKLDRITQAGAVDVRTAATCPHSPQQVRERIDVAFNDDNPNTLAGLFDWRGFSRRSANAKLKEFSRWLKHPFVGVEFSGPADPSGARPEDADYSPDDPSGLVVLTQSPGSAAPEARSFGMTARGDCWWLSF
ncbi:MAG: hypothetical protein ACTHMO_04965 [Rhodanobacteraceae bacterium]